MLARGLLVPHVQASSKVTGVTRHHPERPRGRLLRHLRNRGAQGVRGHRARPFASMGILPGVVGFSQAFVLMQPFYRWHP